MLLPSLRAASTAVMENRFADDTAAQAAWRPMTGSAAATTTAGPAGTPAVRLPCNFAGTSFERASWDRKVNLDLAACRGLQFDFFCLDAAPVGQFSIYFQSGEGWYAGSFQPEVIGAWTVVTVTKAALRVEGRPAGWDRISTVRVSAWRARNVDTEMRVGSFRRVGVLGEDATVAIVRPEADPSAKGGAARAAEQFLTAVTEGFESQGIGCATPGEAGLTAAQVRGARLVVLPHNPALPAGAVAALREYLRGGGKLLAFYQLPRELAEAIGITTGRLVRAADQPGGFAAIRVNRDALPGAPERVRQRSWNVVEARPAGAEGRVVAEWLGADERETGKAAILLTRNGAFMTHVLLNEDRANQQRLLLAMAGALVPELWAEGSAAALARLGRIGDHKEFAAAAAAIERAAVGNLPAREALGAARSAREQALTWRGRGRHAEALDEVARATQKLTEAYCRVQPAAPGEFRAFWCHSALGVDGLTWDEALGRLAAAGFTAIFPNMLWGGVAYYPSEVLPIAREVAERGDQIAACLAAARRHGIEVHVWKVNFNAGHRAPPEFLERMRREGRLQVSSRGQEEPWLCPSHPENQALEVAAMVEVARKYPVDGIHFDYIRYPDGDHCFCTGCRERFGRLIGREVARWPQDVQAGGPGRERWLDWRRSNITAVVEAVRAQSRAVRPGVKVSAAVFRNWSTDRDGVGQDWKLWCDRGWLDFVCPMDYTGSARQFDTWVEMQREWAGGVPVYPGIGVSSSASRLPVDEVIAQIGITRRHGTRGFILFNYGVPESRDLVPLLGLGATAKGR
ncbi:MAG: family 10 glycosylhydrolase [Verrucomicrobia bacterium]|nr:family 10 glycosylhydrolase [Verrucomicrobiota bacterium]